MEENKKNHDLQRFMVVMHKIRLMNNRSCQDMVCSSADFGAMMAIKIALKMSEDGLIQYPSTSEVARQMGATMPAVSKTVRNLTMKGLIRQIPGEEDRRITRLCLTEKGEAIMEAHHRNRHEIMRSSMERLGEEKARQLHDLIGELANIMEEEIDKRNV